MSSLAITGASGFIGRTLLAALPAYRFTDLRLLVHDKPALEFPGGHRVIKVNADLLDPPSLHDLIVPGSTVVHLAYLATAHPEEDNLMAARNLLAACRKGKIRRLIYCSTAVVAGNLGCDVVNETTECRVANGYEAAKFAVERLVLQELHGMEVAVLRPTAVFGAGGRNLVKLAQDLIRLNSAVNYAKSCLQGRRRMNLVHVDNVAAALTFLTDARHEVGGEVYIVSDDESPLNNYRDVERHLFQGLGIPYYPLPPIALPRGALSVALKMAGRTNTNPDRVYDGSKLVQAGLRKPMSFERGLASFASWYRSFNRTEGATRP